MLSFIAHPSRVAITTLQRVGLVALLCAIPACKQAPMAGQGALPDDRPLQGRSLSLDTPAMIDAQNSQIAAGEIDGSIPWYAYRNDQRPYVESGTRGATYEQSYTRTTDSTYSNTGGWGGHSHFGSWGGNNVNDQYSSTTYRTRITEGTR